LPKKRQIHISIRISCRNRKSSCGC